MFNLLKEKLIIKKKSKVFLPGSALVLTIFILAGMLLVAISSSYVVTLGIKAGGIQAQSTKAYFIAESGIEEFLWQLRKNDYAFWEEERPRGIPIFVYDLVPETAFGVLGKYEVYRKEGSNLIWRSIGEFGNTKRAVEVEI